MQATITRRFWTCLVVILGTTLIPWLVYGGLAGYAAARDLEDARAALADARSAGAAQEQLEAAEFRVAEAERKLEATKAEKYELNFGLDLKGGASITFRVRAGEGQDQAEVLRDAIQITQFRVDKYGVSEVNIVESGVDQFTVELPGRGKEEIDRIKKIMSTVGSLEFRIVAEAPVVASERARRDREKESYVPTRGLQWYRSDEGEDTLLEVPDLRAKEDLAAARAAVDAAAAAGKGEAELAPLRARVTEAERALSDARARHEWTGEDLESVSFGKAPITEGTGYEVYFSMVPSRKTAFGDFTGDNIDRQMAIVLSGSVHTAPVIHSKLPGGGKIYSGQNPYTQEQAQDLVTVLQSGSLKVTPEEVSSFIVGPGLGEDAVRRGRIAVGISFLLVIAFMAVFYKGGGWVANLALLLNLLMTLGVLMFIGAALSLPGIAGLLLTLGMAVDANILVNERIREEKVAGKGILQAVTAGYERAFITILDANLTTIITAAILYWIGTGPIRGFALTLILGLSISMFTALYLTRTLFLWGIEKGILTEFRMLRVLGRIDYGWMDLRRICFRISIPLLAVGTALFLMRSVEDKYDLDFTGGQKVVVSLKEPMSIADAKERIAAAGLGDVAIRTIRGRGTDSDKLDLTTASDSFEFTARISDEREGAEFTRRVQDAFRPDMVPNALEDLRFGEKDATGGLPFTGVINFETETVTETDVREMLSTAPLIRTAREFTVSPTASFPGAVSFELRGTLSDSPGKDPHLTLAEEIHEAVEAREGIDLSEPVPQSDFIGPGVARRLRDQAMMAVLLSLIAQIVYLRFRFRDFNYGFAAAIALAHDVLLTLGAVAAFDALGLVHVKINLPVIAAFLTLIGYSMNDTIVVFDRIRENLGRSVHPSSTLINTAINQTLARSIRTTATVLLVAVTLLVVNYGAASSLEGFAFVMTVGVITGTYSTIAIAGPMLLFLPVYRAGLARLGRGVALGLLGAFFAGMALAISQDGVPATAGIVMACLLPAHMAVHLLRWINREDADELVLKATGAAA